MYPAAGGAGHDLIAVRSIGRRRIGQPHLNVHAGRDASKDQLRHFFTLALPMRHALTCLKSEWNEAPCIPLIFHSQEILPCNASNVRPSATRSTRLTRLSFAPGPGGSVYRRTT